MLMKALERGLLSLHKDYKVWLMFVRQRSIVNGFVLVCLGAVLR